MDTVPEDRVTGRDHPHVWLWRLDGRFTCMVCEAEKGPSFRPPGRIQCDHPEWLQTPNHVLTCTGCGMLREG